ncbi:MAG: hypothetical protein EHM75_09280 [Desulfobacteraceae bacterium]|nr:MAG: hypothetical protein EHM75_09280 [Desulfobacteraceae bacterium]
MSDAFLLNQLEELANKLGVKVRYENITLEESSSTGGLCRLKGEYVLIIHSQAPVKEKIQVIAKVVKRFPLGDIYIRPVLRELLGESKG